VGTAYNLRTAATIAGTYKAASVGLMLGAGGQVARWHGFKMRTVSSSNWLEHSLA